MRTWRAPDWLTEQQARRLDLLEHGKQPAPFAKIYDHARHEMLEMSWDHTDDEYDRNLFRLRIGPDRTLVLDKEELRHWLGHV